MMEFTGPRQGRKHRAHMWIDTVTFELKFGVQCNVTRGKWTHVAVDGAVFLRPTKEEAAAAAKAWSMPAANDNQAAQAA